RLPARPLLLPVLRRPLPGTGADLRPCRAALARRPHHLDQRRHRLPGLQPAEGQPPAARIAHAPEAPARAALDPPAAGEWPPVPAQLPARELARLSLLGQRAGSELATPLPHRGRGWRAKASRVRVPPQIRFRPSTSPP